MPRSNRNFKIGGMYHILNRGVEKREIFLNYQDYSRFILGLEFFNSKDNVNLWNQFFRDYKISSSPAGTVPAGEDLFLQRVKRFRSIEKKVIVEILAFALMPNHFHLILREITEGGISLFMRKMGGYSTYFNQQHGRSGVLFQNRYKSVEIKDDIQLANIFNYVHTNPIELVEPNWKDLKVNNEKKALEFLNRYKWSSYNDYVGKEMYPHAIDTKFYLDYFGDEKGCKQSVEDWIKFKAKNADLGSIEVQ